MDTVADSLVGEIALDLSRVWLEHSHAVARRRTKDTPAHRALVAETSAQIDALLDMYLDVEAAGRRP